MTAALVRHLHGAEVAKAATDFIEFERTPDPARDPFAGLAGSRESAALAA
ncbi:hypothetical protein ACFVYA_38525 [Amycolatopsis sp. NPDC058278]